MSKSLESEALVRHPDVVAVKVAGQNLPTSGGAQASTGKTVPERYDELMSTMTSYGAELQTTAVTTKTVKEDSKALLKWLVQVKKQLEGLKPFQEDVEIHQTSIIQFKVGSGRRRGFEKLVGTRGSRECQKCHFLC